MIICKQCGFEVNSTMRHSLTKNTCPSCGGVLLGDLHTRRMNILKQKLMEQDFASELNSDLIFDISMFMLTEFFPSKPGASSDSEADEEGSLEDGVLEVEDLLVEDKGFSEIREEIRSQVFTEIEDEDYNEEVDMKVARLKRIAKESTVLRKPGVTVRRSEP
tara:strand:- start:4703 stop:5188 length:486 start_codon:yes stop_codon:yes gene_type:complete